MMEPRKKEAAPCSLNGADTASFKLDQNYLLTQFILQTPCAAKEYTLHLTPYTLHLTPYTLQLTP